MNVLVTGGSGFIGTKLVAKLLEEGHSVKILDKNPSEAFPDRVLLGDVRDLEAVRSALKGQDVVYHLAAEHRDDVRPVSLYQEVNVGGGQNLVQAMAEEGVRRLIFTSTVALYGLNVEDPDESTPPRPFNAYGRSKYESEGVFMEWQRKGADRRLAMVRPTVVFGEENRGNVYNLLRQLATGTFFMVGSGENRKSMAYVANVAEFLVHLMGRKEPYGVYNYADKPDLTMNELVDLGRSLLGQKKRCPRVPYALGLFGGICCDQLSRATGRSYPVSSIRVKKFCASSCIPSGKAFDTGFVPPYTLKQGLRRMIAHEFLGEEGQGMEVPA